MSTNSVLDLEDQARLNLTLKTREKIITTLTQDGKIPDDESDRSLLIKALDGMDRTVLTKAKIKSDDANSKSQVAASNMVAQMLLNMNKAKGVPRTESLDVIDMEVNPVQDETFIGVKTFSYEEMISDTPKTP